MTLKCLRSSRRSAVSVAIRRRRTRCGTHCAESHRRAGRIAVGALMGDLGLGHGVAAPQRNSFPTRR